MRSQHVAPDGFDLYLGRDDLVVLSGLPGAGKSTMLRAIENRADAAIVDSEQVRSWLSDVIGGAVSYRWYRPLVHIVHRIRIALYAIRPGRPVIAHEPATRSTTRALLVFIGVLTGRNLRLIWLHSTAEEAANGQRARGRTIRSRSFARHVRRAAGLEKALERGRLAGWDSVDVLHRPAEGARLIAHSADAYRVG